MMKQVVSHEVQGLRVLIGIVDKINGNTEVKIIQQKLLDMLNDPAKYKCCSKDKIDEIFVGPSGGDWADEKDGGAYSAIKPTFKLIKELMFKDNSDCLEINGSDHW